MFGRSKATSLDKRLTELRVEAAILKQDAEQHLQNTAALIAELRAEMLTASTVAEQSSRIAG